jgi:hypothetical protein
MTPSMQAPTTSAHEEAAVDVYRLTRHGAREARQEKDQAVGIFVRRWHVAQRISLRHDRALLLDASVILRRERRDVFLGSSVGDTPRVQ